MHQKNGADRSCPGDSPVVLALREAEQRSQRRPRRKPPWNCDHGVSSMAEGTLHGAGDYGFFLSTGVSAGLCDGALPWTGDSAPACLASYPQVGGQGVGLQLSGQGREPWTSGGQVGTQCGRQQADGLQVRNMGSLGARCARDPGFKCSIRKLECIVSTSWFFKKKN